MSKSQELKTKIVLDGRVNPSLQEAFRKANKLSNSTMSKIASVGKTVAKVSATAMAATGAAIVKLSKDAVTAYAEYEQLVGGVDTLFKDSSGKLQEYASQAYKTAGLSANKYMETATSFSASMIASLDGDTKKASKLTDMAIRDMSDNANKMGTNMESIIDTYKSLSRGNYAMLDNLKLGFGGTKKEMERLIAKAEELGKVDLDISSFSDVVKAIHIIQDNMGITGTTALEAEKTISGSLASLKASWENLLPSLIIGGKTFDRSIDNLIDTFLTFKDNIMPAVEKVLYGIGRLIEELAPTLEKILPELIDSLLPPLIKATTALIAGLIKSLPSIIKALIKEIPHIINELGQAIAEAIGGKSFAKPIKIALGASLVGGFVAFKGSAVLKSAKGAFSKIKDIGNATDGAEKGLNPLQKFANLNPKIILKGLGNLAIIVGGLAILATALMAAAPYIAKLSDVKSIKEVLAVMVSIGVIGSAMTGLAGLIGKIPVPLVLTGLANIALVLGGLTLIIVAFAALSKIKGFNEFIKKGGETLANLFNQIGKIAGSLVGGIGEGIADSLPKIGEKLTEFAQSIKPMFDVFKGADVKGIGSFFKSMGSFMLQMAGNDIASFFTGGTDLKELASDLTDFADKSSGFFTKVATFPENGFSNATKLFKCLSGIKSLPKEGGIKGWFNGSINYTDIASGLSKLSGEKVTGFFNSVSTMPETGFTNATKLFNCLGGLKSLPKEGGIKGWFSGDVNYENIASGLKSLSSEGVRSFFTMTGTLKDTSFTNATKLFKCLAGLGNLTSGGGFWERAKDGLFGEGQSMLSQIGADLGKLATNLAPFFNQINNLNLTNLLALPKALNSIVSSLTNLTTITTIQFSSLMATVNMVCVNITTSLMLMAIRIKLIFMTLNLQPAGVHMMNTLLLGILRTKQIVLNAVDSIVREINRKFSTSLSNISTKVQLQVSNIKAKIPQFGTGGTVTTPQMAIVGDRPETIVPHGNNPRNRSLLAEAARGVGASIGGGQTVTFNFAPVINGGNVEDNRRMLQEEEAEFERKMDSYLARKGRLAF